jgi:hypothetical protein
MVFRTPRPRMRRAHEPKASKIKLVDKHIHHPDKMILVDPVLKTIRKQRHLLPINPFNET